jgi:hypothetical protein
MIAWGRLGQDSRRRPVSFATGEAMLETARSIRREPSGLKSASIKVE